ncbi:pantothenate synthetase [Tamilnaduibacter salinus]|uniref:Pantothenate synthetase n=1 Tax=Tamilnaduibacter salinus TaxID=1484056 RepID=A0A2A2I701_9GAMM|nr:pantoate--beta-alanine ligase [Tamilnaduibacter salinus]PAV27519.1 pantoate--beta-alanine ligase [Tamilnaduibacter salinus]PVY77030.1 pantothenate synthetase [Tamilnaduibacter salinus]
MKTIHTVQELRQQLGDERDQGRRIALVPTMGNLHEGHLALVRRATELGDTVVTSIFVNPMQFGPNEDLAQYPRTLPDDQEKLAANGNHIVFAPNVHEVYPNGLDNQTSVSVPGVSEGHCGASRPGHFDGVSTVVTMLFNMVQPHVAVFGEKDFQQLAVIRKLTRDLFLPVEVIGVATTRESDGLAMSSRNGYLSESERATAPALYQTLLQTAQALGDGSKDFAALERAAREALTQAGFCPDYVNIVNSLNLEPATPDDRQLTILAAAFLGDTRLIDNVSVSR